MTDIRDVLQHRTTSLAHQFRNDVEFDASVAKSAVRRKRTVRAALTSSAAVVGVIAVGSAAWAGYDALNPAPAAPPTPSATPSDLPSATPSATPSPTALERLESATQSERTALQTNPRTSEVWTGQSAFETDLDIIDLEYWTLVQVGENGDAAIVAMAPRSYDIFDGGRRIAALLEVDDDGARIIECPRPVAGLCPQDMGFPFGEDVSIDHDTFYDTLALPWGDIAAGGVPLYIATGSPLGDASAWTDFITIDPDYEPAPWASAVDDTPLGSGLSMMVRAYGDAAVPGLKAYDYAVRSPFGSYMPILHEAIGGFEAEGFTWDDGAPLELWSAEVCGELGDQACPDRWVSAEERCFPLGVTEDPHHRDRDWVAAGTTADGRTAYVPANGGNDVARAIFETMRDSSWDLEGDAPNYGFDTYQDFLEARSVITFQLDDERWIIAISPIARNNPYECA
jgi:hypothetical protein